jgi:hypothetical protein
LRIADFSAASAPLREMDCGLLSMFGVECSMFALIRSPFHRFAVSPFRRFAASPFRDTVNTQGARI